MDGVLDFHEGPPFAMGLVATPQITGGALLLKYYTGTRKLASGGHGKDIGLRRVRIDLLSCGWQIKYTFSWNATFRHAIQKNKLPKKYRLVIRNQVDSIDLSPLIGKKPDIQAVEK